MLMISEIIQSIIKCERLIVGENDVTQNRSIEALNSKKHIWVKLYGFFHFEIGYVKVPISNKLFENPSKVFIILPMKKEPQEASQYCKGP